MSDSDVCCSRFKRGRTDAERVEDARFPFVWRVQARVLGYDCAQLSCVVLVNVKGRLVGPRTTIPPRDLAP